MSLVRSLAGSAVKPLASSITGAGGGASPLLTDLAAYWDLDESSGNRADSGPNGYTLTDNNTVGSAAGVGGGQTAASFVRANNEFLSLADNADIRIGDRDWTAVLWLRPLLTSTETLLGKGSGSSQDYRLEITGSGSIGFTVRNAADNASASASRGAATLTANTWYCIECGYDAAADQVFFSINADTYTTAALSGGSRVSADPLGVGDYGNGAFSNNLDGRLQAFGLWHRRLTSAERTFLYNSGAAARLYSDVEAYTG